MRLPCLPKHGGIWSATELRCRCMHIYFTLLSIFMIKYAYSSFANTCFYLGLLTRTWSAHFHSSCGHILVVCFSRSDQPHKDLYLFRYPGSPDSTIGYTLIIFCQEVICWHNRVPSDDDASIRTPLASYVPSFVLRWWRCYNLYMKWCTTND
jgi:hypothetical protein